MLVTMPMRPTSPCAMKPVAAASSTDQTEIRTTRLSMWARSIGTRGSVMSGATGIPSVVAAPSTLRSLRCRICLRYRLQMPAARRRVIFEQHRRRTFVGIEAAHNLVERIGETLSVVRRQALEDREKPFLCHWRRFLQQRAAGARQVQHEPPRIAFIAVARDQARFDEARDDDRDR